jgi:hypothetical protein
VVRNAPFWRLVADVAHTTAFLVESGSGPDEPHRHEHEHKKKMYNHTVPRDRLLDASLLSAEGERPEEFSSPESGARDGMQMQGTVGNAIRVPLLSLARTSCCRTL